METRDQRRFIGPPQQPSYLDPAVRGSLPGRAEAALQQLAACQLCPRQCQADRLQEDLGVCQSGRYARVASAFPHFGEEDCLRGSSGSGTIFFASCSLRCVFCQNWDISQRSEAGRELIPQQLAELMLDLQEQGCHNINFVTPTHVVPQIIEALVPAIEAGLHLPLIYNTSAYDTVASLKLLEGLVDIYMPDFKFFSPQTAERLAAAPDYPQHARAAIREMHRQVGDLRFASDGVAQHGLLVRHLVMPGQLDESRQILQWLARDVSPHTFINIMGQYRPENRVGGRGPERFEEIDRRPSAAELDAAYVAAQEAGLWRFDERVSIIR